MFTEKRLTSQEVPVLRWGVQAPVATHFPKRHDQQHPGSVVHFDKDSILSENALRPIFLRSYKNDMSGQALYILSYRAGQVLSH